MYSAKNIKWLKYIIYLALTGFVLLLILSNVKTKTYYREQNAAKRTTTSAKPPGSRSILSLEESSARAVDCSTSECEVTCSGDMNSLNKFLDLVAVVCSSIKLTISKGVFPNDQLHKNWLKGKFSLSSISITGGTLTSIQSGAFDQSTVVNLTELDFNEVQLHNITEDTFVGLKSINKFTLVNQIESFVADGFLKPMMSTLSVLRMKHITSRATDPEPWLRGGSYPELQTIIFDGSNFGGYITSKTFALLMTLSNLSLVSCQITSIADGAFDSLILNDSPEVLINLQHNQLKRLSGNYLTGVRSSRRVDIQYNPWDCTCQLEDLVNEFKRFPEGFGEGSIVKCSSPPKFEGTFLGDVNIEPCEETVSTPSTNTNTSSSSSPSSITIPSSTIDPETPSPSTPSSTESTSASTTTSDSETPSNLTSSTTDAAPSSTESTNTSTAYPSDLETSSSSNTSTPSLPTPQSPNTTHSVTPSTPTTPTTAGESSTPTSSPPRDTISITCQDTPISYQQDPSTSKLSFVELSQPNTHFSILRRGEKSVKLILEDPLENLAVIWFFDQPNLNETGDNVHFVDNFSVDCKVELENSVLIRDLATNQAYIFCLVKKDEYLVSPFNCQSYYTGRNVSEAIDADEVWLKREDIALTISLLIFGIIVSFCSGVIGMFVVLRMKPTLLKGSKRVVVVNSNTGDVLVMPRSEGKSSLTDSSYRSSSDTNTTIRQRRFSDTSIQSGRSYLMANNYEDIEYRWKMNAVNDLMYGNRIPTSLPPPLPKRISEKEPKETPEKITCSIIAIQKGNDYGYIS